MGTVRFLLALCVVITHSKGSTLLGYYLFSGVTAVQCFYVISGFLITMRLNESKAYESVGKFYLSRYLRLWPTYIVVALATLYFIKQDAMFSMLPAAAGGFETAFIWFSNLTLFFQDWFFLLRFDGGHFAPAVSVGTWPGPQPFWFLIVPQAWTLGIELTFYAIAPFVCRRWWSVALLFAFGAVVRIILARYQPQIDPWVYRFAPSEMMMFGAGGLAYFAGRHVLPRFPRSTRIACVVLMAAFIAITFGGQFFTPYLAHYFGTYDPVFKIVYWPVTLLMVLAVAPLFYGAARNRFDSFIGELSYPMYISHLLVGDFVVRHVPESMTGGNLLYAGFVVAVSAALYLMIAKPTDRYLRSQLGARA